MKHAKRAAESIGLKPTTVFSNGGLDANWFVKHGVPTVTIGAGQYEIHTVKEYVDLPEFCKGAGWRWSWRRWKGDKRRQRMVRSRVNQTTKPGRPGSWAADQFPPADC